MSAQNEFYLNPDLDFDFYSNFFREHGFVQIPDIFERASAETIAIMLSNQVPWRRLITDSNNKPIHFDDKEWQALTQEKRYALIECVNARARQNCGFSYYTYPMIEAILRGCDKGHPIHQVTELINSPTFLDIGRIVTGVDGITKADAHACKYEPGQFLTRHLDLGEDLERRAAYVLGFTKGWQPDWGGLLLFLKDNQDINFGFIPRFNNLTIFDIKFLHTVTQVSTFAGAPRLTITGWFRDDPTPRQS